MERRHEEKRRRNAASSGWEETDGQPLGKTGCSDLLFLLTVHIHASLSLSGCRLFLSFHSQIGEGKWYVDGEEQVPNKDLAHAHEPVLQDPVYLPFLLFFSVLR